MLVAALFVVFAGLLLGAIKGRRPQPVARTIKKNQDL